MAISADGSTIVGAGDSTKGHEAFRWTQATGMVGLGDLASGDFNSSATDVSYDGQVVVGIGNRLFKDPVGNKIQANVAFIWTPSKGMHTLMPMNGYGSSANAVSGDGKTVVGSVYLDAALTKYAAFTWSEATGRKVVRTPTDEASFLDCNADGSMAVGWGTHIRSMRWAPSIGKRYLPFIVRPNPNNPSPMSSAMACSGDGTKIVGWDTSHDQWTQWHSSAFLWTNDTDTIDLGVPPGYSDSYPYGISPDGKLVFGSLQPRVGYKQDAFLWSWDTGMMLVSDYLTRNFADMSAWDYVEITGANSSNTALVGNAYKDGVSEAILIQVY